MVMFDKFVVQQANRGRVWRDVRYDPTGRREFKWRVTETSATQPVSTWWKYPVCSRPHFLSTRAGHLPHSYPWGSVEHIPVYTWVLTHPATSTLKTEAECTSETSVTMPTATQENQQSVLYIIQELTWNSSDVAALSIKSTCNLGTFRLIGCSGKGARKIWADDL
jgi:hypothetical protein